MTNLQKLKKQQQLMEISYAKMMEVLKDMLVENRKILDGIDEDVPVIQVEEKIEAPKFYIGQTVYDRSGRDFMIEALANYDGKLHCISTAKNNFGQMVAVSLMIPEQALLTKEELGELIAGEKSASKSVVEDIKLKG